MADNVLLLRFFNAKLILYLFIYLQKPDCFIWKKRFCHFFYFRDSYSSMLNILFQRLRFIEVHVLKSVILSAYSMCKIRQYSKSQSIISIKIRTYIKNFFKWCVQPEVVIQALIGLK